MSRTAAPSFPKSSLPTSGSRVRFFVPIARPALGLVITLYIAVIAFVADAASAATAGDDHDPIKEALFQGLNLVIILGVLFYFGRGPVAAFFASRRDGIQSELAEAADLLGQAEQRNADLQRRLVDLSSEVEEIRELAIRRAEEEAERILADARATADRIRRAAQAAVDQELRRAQAELRDEAADLALEIAARKLTENVSDGDRDRLMDEFITRVEPDAGTADEGAS